MQTQQTNIFEHTNYRTFLGLYAEEKRKTSPQWSYGLWAKKLQLSGTSALTMVLNGQRNAGDEMCEKFATYFKFNEQEKNYFFDLVRLEKVKDDPRLKALLMEKMAKSHPSGTFKILDEKSFRLIANWYYYAILEMTDLSSFQNDPDWIVGKLNFKITATEAKNAIRDLIKLDLLKIDSEGKLKKSSGHVDTSNDIASEAIKRFHEQMIGHAKEGLRTIPVEKRDFSGITLALGEKDLPRAKELIRKFQDDFYALLANKNEEKKETVYQFNIQLFPLTK